MRTQDTPQPTSPAADSSAGLQPGRRDLAVAGASVYLPYVNRWAVVVGIAKHEEHTNNPEYADRDAADLVGTPPR